MKAVLSKYLLVSKLTAIVGVASVVFAASPAIGIITASGHFTVERSVLWGNSTLFDGARVETGAASSELALRNGVKMQLGAASRAQVWENRLMLEKGVGQIAAPSSFEVNAGGLKIHSGSENARVRVGLGERVEVTTLTGIARVASSSGLLMAAIPAGRSMMFSLQAGTTGSVKRTGCLLYKDGHFILQDENTQEVVELSGKDFGPSVGNRIEVTGTVLPNKPAVSIATMVLNVSDVAPKSQGGCLSVASALNARTDVPPTTGTVPAEVVRAPKTGGGGISTGAKVGIVAVVAGGGAGAAIALSGKKKSTSP